MPISPLLAIFVGGQSTRMGEPKGLLRRPGSAESIVETMVRRGREAGLFPVFVGEAASYAHVASGIPRIDDDPIGAGPLGGLNAAIRFAVRHGHPSVVAVACDMPHVDVEVLVRIVQHRSLASVLAPRRGDDAPWEPMLARYRPDRLAPVLDEVMFSEVRSFQALFALLEIEALPLTEDVERALEDWDTPDDVGA